MRIDLRYHAKGFARERGITREGEFYYRYVFANKAEAIDFYKSANISELTITELQSNVQNGNPILFSVPVEGYQAEHQLLLSGFRPYAWGRASIRIYNPQTGLNSRWIEWGGNYTRTFQSYWTLPNYYSN